jgi:hypothetical protein
VGEGLFGRPFVPARRGEKVGLTRREKGGTVMMVVDGQGLPLGVLLESAQRSEVKLAEEALRPVRVPRRVGGEGGGGAMPSAEGCEPEA